jgi:transcriptional regulator with XRE-family HTH domain
MLHIYLETITMASIAERLKEARERAGVTLIRLAERTGYAITTLSGVENGHDRPSKRLLGKWIEALQLKAAWVETGEGEVFRSSNVQPLPNSARNLDAPLRSRIRKAREHALGLLDELDLIEKELTRSPDDRRP